MSLRHREWHRTDRIGWLRAERDALGSFPE